MNDRDQRTHFERVSRSLLWRIRPPQLQECVDELLCQTDQFVQAGSSAEQAFHQVILRARDRVVQRLVSARQKNCQGADRDRGSIVSPAARRLEKLLRCELASEPDHDSPDFHCDAGLGGLARWLRAAGYDARWWPGINDDALLQKMHATAAILLTTDRRLTDRGVLQHGVIPALLVPISLGKHDQLSFCLKQLDLPAKAARCMACGGMLQQVSKFQVRDRIPPRTFPWRNDYFECCRCRKLFWQGTHWQTIEQRLRRASRPEGSSSSTPDNSS